MEKLPSEYKDYIKLFVKDELDQNYTKIRNLIVFVLFLISSLVGLGVWQNITNLIEDNISKQLNEKMLSTVEKNNAVSKSIIQEMKQNNRVIKNKINEINKLYENQGFVVQLTNTKKSQWYSKTPLLSESPILKDHVVVGIDFRHKSGENFTHQEEFRLTLAEMVIVKNPALNDKSENSEKK